MAVKLKQLVVVVYDVGVLLVGMICFYFYKLVTLPEVANNIFAENKVAKWNSKSLLVFFWAPRSLL